MPKLNLKDVLRNKRKIEAAALKVFVRQGFHGTSIRDIATSSGVSIGNIYTYYKTKEELYGAIAENYEAMMQPLRVKAIEAMAELFDHEELVQLAYRIRDIVYRNSDYWRLMYIDVTEFGNQHFAHIYRNLANDLKSLLGARLKSPKSGDWRGIDPAVAFTGIYLQLYTYFLVETLFGGKQHLGVSDDDAIQQLINIFLCGIGVQVPPAKSRPGKTGGKK